MLVRLFSLAFAAALTATLPAAAQETGPPPEIKITVVEGDGALNNIRERTAKDPIVRVENDDGQAIQGASVTFLLPDLGAGGSFSGGLASLTTTTDSDGRAAGRGLRPNNIAGQFDIRITASYRGRTATAVITQTNVAPAAVRGGRNRKFVIAGVAAAGAVVGALFAARGGNGGTSTGPPAPTGTTVTPGSPVFGPPR